MIANGHTVRSLLIAALFLSAFSASPRRALAWGAKGHQIVANVAAERLSSRARKGTADLLGGASLEAVSTWGDSTQAKRRGADFILIPLDAKDSDLSQYCQKDCLIKSVQDYTSILGNFNRPRAERAEALRYVIHLIGDLHQPLHCADNGDAGGNKTRVTFFGRATTLHKVWDSDLIGRENKAAAAYARDLSSLMGRNQYGNVYTGGTAVDWALDSHRVAKRAYQLPAGGKLGEEYYRANKPLADEQLYKAGVRLARVLNDIFR